MKDAHTTKSESSFGKKLWCVLIVVFLGGIGWQVWKFNAYNNAVRQAKEAGFEWDCDDTISLIQQDWRNALKKETWGEHERVLYMGEVPDLGRYREMLHHLNPTELIARGCENVDSLKGLTGLQKLALYECTSLRNVDSLKGLTGLHDLCLNGSTALQNGDILKDLTGLQKLNISSSPSLQNVDGLKGLTSLQRLDISSCTALENVDGLKGLTTLQALDLTLCTTLQNVEGLKRLTTLQTLDLSYCDALQNVDALKNLTALKSLSLFYCTKIPAAALRELRAALPNTVITFPDGTNNPPQ